jgi:hypothetical protein
VRLAILAVSLGLMIACAAPRPAEPALTATPKPPTSTPALRPATATPAPNYREMRTRLTTPLGAMIIALRQNDRSAAAAHLAEFNQEGDRLMPLIESDMSVPASLLHSAIVSVRREPGNLPLLEKIRERLVIEIT